MLLLDILHNMPEFNFSLPGRTRVSAEEVDYGVVVIIRRNFGAEYKEQSISIAFASYWKWTAEKIKIQFAIAQESLDGLGPPVSA